MLLGALFFLQVLVTPMSSTIAPVSQFAKTAGQCNVGGFFGIPTWYQYIDRFDDKCNPVINLREGPDGAKFNGMVVMQIALAIIDILLRIGALLAVGFVMYGGFVYLTSQGEPDGTKRGRQAITNALVGLIITIMASAIVAFIGARLG